MLQRAQHSPPTTTPLSFSRLRRGLRAAAKRLPESARQCPERAASSKSPSSSGRSGSTSSDPRVLELLTPWQRGAILPARQSPCSRGRSLGSRAAGPASLGPWGFASCRAIRTVHTSRPLPSSTRRRGAQPSAHRSSPGISGHGPGVGGRQEMRAARSSCLCRSEAGSTEPRLQARGYRGCMRVPTVRRGWDGRRPSLLPWTSSAPRARGCETRRPADLARAACRLPPPLCPGLYPCRFTGSLGSGSSRECYCSSERRLIDKEST